MSRTFPLAYSTLACPDWTLEQAADAAVEYGYAALELRLLDGVVIPADLPEHGRARVRGVLRRHRLGIVAIGASTGFTQAAPDERRANQAQLIRYLELASDLEAPLVRTFGGAPPPGTGDDEAIERVAASLAELLPRAEQLGVTIGLENHDAFARGAMVARVLELLPNARLAAVWDILHSVRYGEPPARTVQLLGSRLAHVQIKDGRPNPHAELPEDWELTMLDEGAVPVLDILSLLDNSGYGGALSVEWEKKWHPELAEPEIALPQHAERLRAWISERQPYAGLPAANGAS